MSPSCPLWRRTCRERLQWHNVKRRKSDASAGDGGISGKRPLPAPLACVVERVTRRTASGTLLLAAAGEAAPKLALKRATSADSSTGASPAAPAAARQRRSDPRRGPAVAAKPAAAAPAQGRVSLAAAADTTDEFEAALQGFGSPPTLDPGHRLASSVSSLFRLQFRQGSSSFRSAGERPLPLSAPSLLSPQRRDNSGRQQPQHVQHSPAQTMPMFSAFATEAARRSCELWEDSEVEEGEPSWAALSVPPKNHRWSHPANSPAAPQQPPHSDQFGSERRQASLPSQPLPLQPQPTPTLSETRHGSDGLVSLSPYWRQQRVGGLGCAGGPAASISMQDAVPGLLGDNWGGFPERIPPPLMPDDGPLSVSGGYWGCR